MSATHEETSPQDNNNEDDDLYMEDPLAITNDSSNNHADTTKVSLEEYKRHQALFGPKLLSEAEETAAKQLVQDALTANDQDEPMDEEFTIEETLLLLKANLDAARTDVERLCHEGAKLTAQQRKLRQYPVPATEQAERSISSLIDSNSLKLERAEKVVTDTAARIKTLESVRKAGLAPILHDTAVDESNSTHVAIKRIFKYNLIPVLADGISIDWDRVRHDSHVGAPTLNLTTALSKAKTKDVLALPAAQAITTFLESFRTFYKGKLVELFDILAWRYMEAALKPSGLDEEFKALIEMQPVGNRSWDLVSEYVVKITNLDVFRAGQVKVNGRRDDDGKEEGSSLLKRSRR
ncbi:hypothetical protein BGZ58_007597 [Dissophora ornata]|nr:hypothetical protein BGZ58_007597 [Dissophora ornata]